MADGRWAAQHWIDHFRAFYAPVNEAFATLDEAKQHSLHADITAPLARSNRGATSLVVPRS